MTTVVFVVARAAHSTIFNGLTAFRYNNTSRTADLNDVVPQCQEVVAAFKTGELGATAHATQAISLPLCCRKILMNVCCW